MSRTGRAVVACGKDFEIREYPVPEPEPNTELLRQELAGICGTDLHNWQNGFQQEVLLGHENVGIFEALGEGVETDYVGKPVKEGDRVIFAPGTNYGCLRLPMEPRRGTTLSGWIRGLYVSQLSEYLLYENRRFS